jgi:hypothetical protein
MSCWKYIGTGLANRESKICPIEKCQDSPWRGLEVKGSLAEHGCAVAQDEAQIFQCLSNLNRLNPTISVGEKISFDWQDWQRSSCPMLL